ncbi:MAG: glucokinase [Chloroflexi bacterium]|nr:glucokinase [Chloroflexota bacterium]
MLLAGDIGATKTILGIFSDKNAITDPLQEHVFQNHEFDSFESLLKKFLENRRINIRGASFGIAAPIFEDKIKMTNLDWEMDGAMVSERLGNVPVTFHNDLLAMVSFIPQLTESDLAVINPGKSDKFGAIGLIAPGSGLGEAYLVWDGNQYLPLPSEGGHSDFAATNSMEADMLQFLMKTGNHISYESVCSGKGITNIYYYLKKLGDHPEPEWLAKRLAGKIDKTPVIVEAALDKANRCDICEITVNTFINILAAEAGNMALKLMTTGGVYLGGGIPPKILPLLTGSQFLISFANKGIYKDLLNTIPINVILNEKIGLYGAALLGFKKIH